MDPLDCFQQHGILYQQNMLVLVVPRAGTQVPLKARTMAAACGGSVTLPVAELILARRRPPRRPMQLCNANCLPTNIPTTWLQPSCTHRRVAEWCSVRALAFYIIITVGQFINISID